MISRFSATAAPIALLGLFDPAGAATILDPLGVGATGGSAGNQFLTSPTSPVFTTGDLGGTSLFVGDYANAGVLVVDSSTGGNGVTSLVNVGRILLAPQLQNSSGVLPVHDGHLTITGSGASVTNSGSISLGANAGSSLFILNGGQLNSSTTLQSTGGPISFVTQGNYTPTWSGIGSTTFQVDGAGSLFSLSGGNVEIGFTNVYGPDQMMISGGGRMSVTVASDALAYSQAQNNPYALLAGGDIVVGSYGYDAFTGQMVSGSTDNLTVRGSGSTLSFSNSINTDATSNAQIIIGLGGRVEQVETAGFIDAALAYDPNSYAAAVRIGTIQQTALLNIDGTDAAGNASTLAVTRDIQIGLGDQWIGFDASGNPLYGPSHGEAIVQNGGVMQTTRDVNVSMNTGSGTGMLTVATGGTVNAANVNLYNGGTLNGNGGTINANVNMLGGTIAPGNTPGIMTINGDLTYAAGLFDIEIGGTAASQHDRLFVNGDLFASTPINFGITFINGFVPQIGDSFDFLHVLGISSVLSLASNLNFSFFGLGSGQSLSLSYANGGLLANVIAASPAPVPLPAGLPLAFTGILSLALFKRHKLRARLT